MLIKFLIILYINLQIIYASSINLDNYSLIWEDNFNKENLDLNKWNYRYLGKRKNAINDISTVNILDSKYLELSLIKKENHIYSSMISTENSFQIKYGYFEAMIKLPKEKGLQAAIWLQSSTYGQKINDLEFSGAEIDIIEYVRSSPNKVYHSIYYNGYGKDKIKIQSSTKIDSEKWNKIALLWNKNGYYFFINDELVYQTSQGLSHAKQYIILSVEHTIWSGKVRNDFKKDSFLIDYIKVYKEKE